MNEISPSKKRRTMAWAFEGDSIDLNFSEPAKKSPRRSDKVPLDVKFGLQTLCKVMGLVFQMEDFDDLSLLYGLYHSSRFFAECMIEHRNLLFRKTLQANQIDFQTFLRECGTKEQLNVMLGNLLRDYSREVPALTVEGLFRPMMLDKGTASTRWICGLPWESVCQCKGVVMQIVLEIDELRSFNDSSFRFELFDNDRALLSKAVEVKWEIDSEFVPYCIGRNDYNTFVEQVLLTIPTNVPVTVGARLMPEYSAGPVPVQQNSDQDTVRQNILEKSAENGRWICDIPLKYTRLQPKISFNVVINFGVEESEDEMIYESTYRLSIADKWMLERTKSLKTETTGSRNREFRGLGDVENHFLDQVLQKLPKGLETLHIKNGFLTSNLLDALASDPDSGSDALLWKETISDLKLTGDEYAMSKIQRVVFDMPCLRKLSLMNFTIGEFFFDQLSRSVERVSFDSCNMEYCGMNFHGMEATDFFPNLYYLGYESVYFFDDVDAGCLGELLNFRKGEQYVFPELKTVVMYHSHSNTLEYFQPLNIELLKSEMLVRNVELLYRSKV